MKLSERCHPDELDGAERGSRERARDEPQARAGPGMVDQGLQILPDGSELVRAEVEYSLSVTYQKASDPVGEISDGQELISVPAVSQHGHDAAAADQLEKDCEGSHSVGSNERLRADDGDRHTPWSVLGGDPLRFGASRPVEIQAAQRRAGEERMAAGRPENDR